MERGTVACYHRRWALPEPRNMDAIVTVPTFFYFITRLLWGIDGHIILISVMETANRTNAQARGHFSFSCSILFNAPTGNHVKPPPS